jgi:hypothetical protein
MKRFDQHRRVPIHVTQGAGSCTLDASLFPIVPVRWVGEMTPELFDKFWDARDKHLDDFVPTVIFVHAINEINPMNSIVRKYLSDKAKNDPKIQKGLFFSIIVVSNPLIRGTLTAVSWMAGDMFPMDFVSDLNEGIKRAARLEEGKATECPPLPADYKWPASSNVA